MPGLMEHLRTINSFLRTLLAVTVVGGAGAAGWYGYSTYNAKELEAKKRAHELQEAQQALSDTKGRLLKAESDVAEKLAELTQKNAQIAQMQEHIDKLQAALHLLKVDHRVARLTAVDQSKDEATGEMRTLIEFVELNDEGQPMDTPRQWSIRGDVVFIDSWIVKFDDKYVQQADIERGTSLILFQRIFGEMQQPDKGYPLDAVGSAPRAYARGGKMSDFEKRIWDDFWVIANDPARAEQLGIRAAHGQAVSMKLQKGKSYRVQLRASDGLSIVAEGSTPTER